MVNMAHDRNDRWSRLQGFIGIHIFGVGEALNMAAIAEARSRGAITVELTSRPSREAANRLYQRIGFVQRETNIYRYTI